jgi:hypothetical protein
MKTIKLTVQEKISESNEYYFTIIGHNGEPIATSEMYSSKQKCQQTMRLFNDEKILEFTCRNIEGNILFD